MDFLMFSIAKDIALGLTFLENSKHEISTVGLGKYRINPETLSWYHMRITKVI
jgi:hypothetical protein